MPRRLWFRIGLVAVVLVVSLFYLYPPKKRINLGLDLQGGIHLVLGVEADKAAASQTERAAEDFKAALERRGVPVRRVAILRPGAFAVELAAPQNWNDALTVAQEYGNFERRDEDAAAGRFTLAMRDRYLADLRQDTVTQVLERLRNRVDKFGVAEPTITRQGTDRVLVQLPGIQDIERNDSPEQID